MADTGGALSGAVKGASMGAALGPWGALAGGVVGGVAGLLSGNAAAAARKRAAMEELRRADMERNETLGRTTAMAGASGVEVISDSSMGRYLATMTAEFRRQHDWQRRQAEKGESLAGQANTLGFLSTVGSSLFKFGQANNFWQQPAAKP